MIIKLLSELKFQIFQFSKFLALIQKPPFRLQSKTAKNILHEEPKMFVKPWTF